MMNMQNGCIARRIVVKVGTSTLTHSTGKLNLHRLEELARTLTDIKNAGAEVILVSSGAISVGTSKLGMTKRPKELPLKQAAASVGQCELMHIYDKLFGEYGQTVGQILLTGEDVEHPVRRENLLNTFLTLLNLGVVPVVNENDSVSFNEIETGHNKVFGDNDTLSAIVARLTGADLLVLLTDIDGLYDSDPHTNPDAHIIPVVREITDALRAAAGGAGTARGTGGMQTKLAAAELAMQAGIDTVIAAGDAPAALYDICRGEGPGTRFLAPGRHPEK